MTQKKKKKKEGSTNKKAKRIVAVLWGAFIAVILAIVLVFVLITAGWIGYMPPIEDLENPIDKYASQVYSSDNELLGTYSMSKENRIFSSYDELSPYLVQALVATEDKRYYDHSGVDIQALGRVIVKTIFMSQDNAGGGSTITQQLAKQLYSPPAENIMDRALQKPIEWVIATKLERYYTKDEIINLYLNKFDFLNNAVGIQSAAKVYFNKLPKDLNIQEAAMLIGMCQNPSKFNPRNPKKIEATKKRRNIVLGLMADAGYITRQEADSLKQLPIQLDFKRVDHKDGLAPYFREYLRKSLTAQKPNKSNYASWQMTQYSTDSAAWENDPMYGWCNKNKKADGSYYNLYSDGLRIYTTIDSRMQTYAEEAVQEHIGGYLQPLFTREKKGRSYAPFSASVTKKVDELLANAMKTTDRYRDMKKAGYSEKEILEVFKTPADMKVFTWQGEVDTTMTPLDSIRYYKGFLRSGFAAIDPYNGHMKAYVGGIDFKYFQYDMVSIGRRQIGSTIKPYLYTLAMMEGMTPCDQMSHVQQTVTNERGDVIWSPRSGRNMDGAMVSIKWGLQNSDNWVTAWLMKQLSPTALVRLLHSFGVTGDIDAQYALALGTCDVSVGEMVSAYTAFVNKGMRSKPMYITRIEDAHGNIVATFSPQPEEIFDEFTYVKMLDMLRAVIDGGTGGRVRGRYGLQGPMGGKTGTTQNNSDGWFMAFTPELVTGCWVGGEDRSIHFDGIGLGQGASMALPVFGIFMKKVYADSKLGYSTKKQFVTVDGNLNPCAGSAIDESPGGVAEGIDDLFD
ncbi:penicillin-binding protein 1A [Dysgonomonas sp. PH5-45]|uniref:transglycosylase domain-containing protein n=1 Tax=unclassified Dysgonomonas TaxID=2630389 RepID=UPI00247589E4|nr:MULTISPECIES: transglycosylase domain-containing protein [unclassified Dysgonomonas]MDH6355668.1 penicillin-binding protein 1A [Dysgonomonas sp. PH5-45]MDH6388549.1 penicillin-binding protein 1A [Dysgonomonas sp. PH5-37]